MKKFVDYYKVLGLRVEATGPEIRTAYVRLAKEHHPDKGGDSRKMNLVNDAYDTLKNPVSRAQFDRRLASLKRPLVTTVVQTSPSQPAYARVAKKRRKTWLAVVCLILLAGSILALTGRRSDSNASNSYEQAQKQAELDNLKSQYDACVESFDQVTSRLAQINHEMNVAKLNDDTAGHNALIPTQNQVVADYNAKRTECNTLKNQYNERVSSFNESTLP